MPAVLQYRLPLARGTRTPEAALTLAMLEDLTTRLRDDLRGATAAELAWQPAPGHNTIGMLLAHLAVVELWWSVGVLEGMREDTPFTRVLGIGMDDDGMPMPAGGRPPAALAGKSLAWFFARLRKGRAEVTRVARALEPRDVARVRRGRRRSGQAYAYDARWVLHHLVEHFAGHHGQILLLRHLYRARRRAR
jgi:hypothetical protein